MCVRKRNNEKISEWMCRKNLVQMSFPPSVKSWCVMSQTTTPPHTQTEAKTSKFKQIFNISCVFNKKIYISKFSFEPFQIRKTKKKLTRNKDVKKKTAKSAITFATYHESQFVCEREWSIRAGESLWNLAIALSLFDLKLLCWNKNGKENPNQNLMRIRPK